MWLVLAEAPLLRSQRSARRASHDAAVVAEDDEEPIQRRVEGHEPVAGREHGERRSRARVDLDRDALAERRDAPAVPRIGLETTMLAGNTRAPVFAETVIRPPAPTFTVATEHTPIPKSPRMFTMPSPLSVAMSATMSGTGVSDADRSSVLTPISATTGGALDPSNLNVTSVGGNAALGVIAITKVWLPPMGMSTGVLGEPVGTLV